MWRDSLIKELMAKGWTELQARIAVNHFFEQCEDYDCKDNLRFAREGNSAEVTEYENARENGCCGYYDQILECKDGRVQVGFNYGH